MIDQKKLANFRKQTKELLTLLKSKNNYHEWLRVYTSAQELEALIERINNLPERHVYKENA